jgi:hypothetical protein
MVPDRLAILLAAGALIALAATRAHAELYFIEPSSYLALRGTVAGGGILNILPPSGGFTASVTASGSGALAEQAPGSLRTALGGTIDATASGASLLFAPATRIEALASGAWAPSGSPGSLAGRATVPLAWVSPDPLIAAYASTLAMAAGLDDPTAVASTRGLAATVVGTAPLAGPANARTFALDGLSASFVAGTLDVGLAFLSEHFDFAGLGGTLGGAAVGTLETGPDAEILRLPFAWSGAFGGADSIPLALIGGSATAELSGSFALAIEGEIVARRAFAGGTVAAAVPEPSTPALLAAGLCAVGFFALRRAGRQAGAAGPARQSTRAPDARTIFPHFA